MDTEKQPESKTSKSGYDSSGSAKETDRDDEGETTSDESSVSEVKENTNTKPRQCTKEDMICNLKSILDDPVYIKDRHPNKSQVSRANKDSLQGKKINQKPAFLSLDMIQNGLSDLCRNFVNMKFTYSKLTVQKKNVDDVKMLNDFIHLRFIDLSDNCITDLTPLKSLEHLEVLNVFNNNIERPEKIPTSKHLKHLNLGKNKLKTLIGFSSNSIIHLDVRENQLETVEGMTSSIFPKLIYLQLRGNKLKSLKSLDLPQLEKLYAAENSLVNVSGLVKCPMLTILHLRANDISRLRDFPSLVRLNYVNLRANEIKRFTETFYLMHSPNVKTLILADNPIASSSRYRSEMVIANPLLQRLDKISILEAELEEGRNIFRSRMRGHLPPLQDDPKVLTPPPTPMPITENLVENIAKNLSQRGESTRVEIATRDNSAPPNTPASLLCVKNNSKVKI